MEKVQISLPQLVLVKTVAARMNLEGTLNSMEKRPRVVVHQLGKNENGIICIVHSVKQKPDDKYLNRMKKKFGISIE